MDPSSIRHRVTLVEPKPKPLVRRSLLIAATIILALLAIVVA